MHRVGYNFSSNPDCWVHSFVVEMSGEFAMAHCSADSVRSPLKRPVTKTSNPCESVHTCAVDVGDCNSKGSYETARDKRVAKLKELFKPVQEAAKTL